MNVHFLQRPIQLMLMTLLLGLLLFTSGLALPVQAATAQGIYAIKPNGDLFYYQYLGIFTKINIQW